DWETSSHTVVGSAWSSDVEEDREDEVIEDVSDSSDIDMSSEPDLERSSTVWLDSDVESQVTRRPQRLNHQLMVDELETVTGLPLYWPVPRVKTAYLLDLSSDEHNIKDDNGNLLSVDALIKNKNVFCTFDLGSLAPTITIEETLSIDTSKLDWQQEVARVKVDLESSKHCLLSINLKFWSFTVHKGNPNEFEPFISNFRNALIDIAKEIAQHAHRIQHFQLVVDEGATTLCIVAPFFARLMHRLLTWNVQKRLESGWASVSNNWNFDEPSAHSALIQRSGLDFSLYPNLLSVVFRAVPVDWALFMPKNLVSLDISLLSTVFGLSLHDLHRILKANAHSLKNLTLSVALYGKTGFHGGIFLSQLKTLNLGFIHTNELHTFLQALHVPNLEEFGLCDSRFESSHDQWGCYPWDAGIGHLLITPSCRFCPSIGSRSFISATYLSMLPPNNVLLKLFYRFSANLWH
ncbi:hypothetical protein H0H92_008038, partial [Tricholoma furcatifolium]